MSVKYIFDSNENTHIRTADAQKMRLISEVKYLRKMRTMKMFSNQPGVQFYTGNFLPRAGIGGKVILWFILWVQKSI